AGLVETRVRAKAGLEQERGIELRRIMGTLPQEIQTELQESQARMATAGATIEQQRYAMDLAKQKIDQGLAAPLVAEELKMRKEQMNYQLAAAQIAELKRRGAVTPEGLTDIAGRFGMNMELVNVLSFLEDKGIGRYGLELMNSIEAAVMALQRLESGEISTTQQLLMAFAPESARAGILPGTDTEMAKTRLNTWLESNKAFFQQITGVDWDTLKLRTAPAIAPGERAAILERLK
ncbi:MAG: hypothetical protein V3W44_03345, partial [Dehalococcoidales bacterium]